MKKKHLALVAASVAALVALTGCGAKKEDAGQAEPAPAPQVQTEVTEFQYISAADLEKIVTDNNQEYVIFDVRKKTDYDTEHIKGAISADVDSVVSEEKDEPAKANVQAAMASTDLEGKKIVLLCYSGKRYAQASTNILVGEGIDPAMIFTLEGGYKGWTNTELLEK